MVPRSGIEQRWSQHGRWKPPKAFGNNLSGEPASFHFNPTNNDPINNNATNNNNTCTITLSALPPNADLHKTYSIYVDRAIIWTVNYDATVEQVGDGLEHNRPEEQSEQLDHRSRAMNISGFHVQSSASSDMGESDDENEYKDEWAPLKFDHRERDRLSYAGRRQPYSRLRVRRSDQDWPEKLLPDTCSAQETSEDPRHGGLIGELPLLIGLMALAIPPDQLAPGLCQSMGRPWRAPQFARAAGCKSPVSTNNDLSNN